MTQSPAVDPFGNQYAPEDTTPAPSAPSPAPRTRQKPATPSPEAPEAPESDEKSTKKRGTGLAYSGRPVVVPDDAPDESISFPPHPDEYGPTEEEISFDDLGDINRQINRARVALFRGTQILANAKRVEAEKEFLYKRAFNRALLQVSGGTEKTRVTVASLQTENEWGDFLVAQRVAEEATNHLRAIRSELDALAGLSHNIRAQMNVM